jgi:hypothetical protein
MVQWARIREMGDSITRSVEKPKQKKSFETRNRMLEDIIQMDLKYVARLWAGSKRRCLGSSTRCGLDPNGTA